MNLPALDQPEQRTAGRGEQYGGVCDIGVATVLSSAGMFEASA